jgi:hypothetical protein
MFNEKEAIHLRLKQIYDLQQELGEEAMSLLEKLRSLDIAENAPTKEENIGDIKMNRDDNNHKIEIKVTTVKDYLKTLGNQNESTSTKSPRVPKSKLHDDTILSILKNYPDGIPAKDLKMIFENEYGQKEVFTKLKIPNSDQPLCGGICGSV